MKRWAIFDICTDYDPPYGGMGDFVGAFDTKELAELYLIRQVGRRPIEFSIEDMYEYLTRDSPHIPTNQEYNEVFIKHRDSKIMPPANSIDSACGELADKLAKVFYSSPGKGIK